MSFTDEVKAELCTLKHKACCTEAMFYGMLLCGKYFTKDKIGITSGSAKLREIFTSSAQKYIGTAPVQKGNSALFAPPDIPSVLAFCGLDDTEEIRINPSFFDSGLCCKKAFLCGAFCVCGSVLSPEKGYSLEFSLHNNSALAGDFVRLFDDCNELTDDTSEPFFARIANRSGRYSVYFKKAETIENVLTLIGASNSALELINGEIYKQIVNETERKNNLDIANIRKNIESSSRQTEAIKKLRQCGIFDTLPDDLQTVARLRLGNQYDTLSELSEKAGLSKTEVNYRLNKLIRLADDIK